MIFAVDLRYRNEIKDGRITRAEARAWVEDARQGGRRISRDEEAVMRDNVRQYADLFEPGAKEPVQRYLADVAASRPKRSQGLFERIFSALFGG